MTEGLSSGGPQPLRLGASVRAALAAGYGRSDLRADATAGVVVGIVALPLSMALAIASGVPPVHGLFTAVVAGAVIALAGGAPLSVSGPTAAFVVVLAPITARYGIGGLALASAMAGAILIALGALRMGRLIQFIPHPVTTGFTAGIGVVIAILQIGDFIGVGPTTGEHAWDRLVQVVDRLPDLNPADLGLGLLTLAVLAFWPRLTHRLPAPLVALAVAAAAGALLTASGREVATIGTRFGGIPAGLPAFRLPWTQPGLEGLSPAVLGELAPSALAIALLGAIESLLCAVVADGMTGSRHDPDAELVGQGLGNLVAPFFGGFAATGAVARSATAIRAGARSPFAAVVHAGFVLVAMLALAPLLSTLPMAGLAALLLVVAWNMSDARHVVKMLRIAPRSDIAVLLTCLVLTVAFDMVVAVSVGVVLASLLFMRRMAEISGATLVGGEHQHEHRRLPPGVVVYEIAGPLFFGAAERALAALGTVEGAERVVVIDLEDVPAMDATGLVALESALAKLRTSGARVVLADVRPQPARVLARAGLGPGQDWLDHAATVEEALAALTG